MLYASLTSVLAESYPTYTPHMIAYLSTIVGCSKRCNTLSWVAYDAAFRRKKAITKSLAWEVIDRGLYAVWFSGNSRSPSCTHCLSFEHSTSTCPHQMQVDLAWQLPGPAQPTQQFLLVPIKPAPVQSASPRSANNSQPSKESHLPSYCSDGIHGSAWSSPRSILPFPGHQAPDSGKIHLCS